MNDADPPLHHGNGELHTLEPCKSETASDVPTNTGTAVADRSSSITVVSGRDRTVSGRDRTVSGRDRTFFTRGVDPRSMNTLGNARRTLRSRLDGLRVEEHTGENRCIPCTALNLALAVVAGVLVVSGGRRRGLRGPAAIAAGVLTVALATLVIVLRGYLVPGTPWLTRTCLPDPMLRRFGKEPHPEYGTVSDDGTTGDDGMRSVDGVHADHGRSPQADVDEGADVDERADVDEGADVDGTVPGARFDVETRLAAAGVVEAEPTGDDLRLVPSFRETWGDRMADLSDRAERSERVARFLEIDPSRLTFTTSERAVTASVDGKPKGRWESETALVADLAADRELARIVDGWVDVPLRYRSSILQGLRAFLDDCPACGGPVVRSDRPVDSCCRSGSVTAVRCADCGTRIAEITPT